MATQNIAAVPNKTYIQIHFRNVQSLCNIDNGNLSVKRTILANPTMDIPDHTYSLIRILDDRVITEPEEHEDKEIHSEEDIVYHDKYPFNKYEMEKELYSECMDVLHKLEFTITNFTKKGEPDGNTPKDSPFSFTLQKAADIPPSFSVQYSAQPCLCNTGKKHTPYRYSGLLPPVSSTIYFWASCRNLSDGMPRHYSSKQRQSVIQTKILSQLDFLLY